MSDRMRTVVSVALLAAVGAGCATITYEAPLVEGMVAMSRAAGAPAYERIGRFEEDRRVVFVAASLLTVIDAELEEALQRALAVTGGDAVINLRIHEETDIIDVIVGAVTGPLVNSRAVTLEGDIVRWTDGGGSEALLELSQSCRELDVSTRAGGARSGFVCAP
ncbi:MAG: hypothetical protein P8177_11025 [Gemmatimonadota bacterium]|jgi:hypothetical protein